MYDELARIWYVYSSQVFMRSNRNNLDKTLGWEFIPNENHRCCSEAIDRLYKDHILIKIGETKGRECYRSCDTYSLYLADDINDPEPILIYYCYDYKEAPYSNAPKSGWINIDYWSIFAMKLIEDSMTLIYTQEKLDKIEKFKKYIKDEKFFTEEMKPELRKLFKNKMKNLDIDNILRLTKEILKDNELNNYTRKKDMDDAKLVADILSETKD